MMASTKTQGQATINTKKVQGRRQLRLESLDELLGEAERLCAAPVRTLGNWSLGQILLHLARAFDTSVDGNRFMLPAPVRWLMAATLKRRFLTRTIPSGFKVPAHVAAELVPGDTDAVDGLAALRCAVERLQREPQRAPHPALGQLTREEWDQFHLRHAEMHLSFVVPAETNDA